MARIPLQTLAHDSGLIENLAYTTGVPAGMEFYNGGQTLLFLYGGSGATGGHDVVIGADTSLDIGAPETLTVSCGSTSANNLTIVGNFKARNFNALGVGPDVSLAPADASVTAAAVQFRTATALATPAAFENVLVGAGAAPSIVGGNSVTIANDGKTFIVVVSGTSASAVTLTSDLVSGDSRRIKSQDATLGSIGAMAVFGPRNVGDHGGTLTLDVTSSGSTNVQVFAFSLATGRAQPIA